MLSTREGLDAEAELLEQPEDVELSAEDSDGAGQRRGLGDDVARAHRDEVAARGRIVAHADDHRFGTPASLDLVPDLVRRRARAARTVDAQNNGADRAARARVAQ